MHLLVSEPYIYQNARCNDKKKYNTLSLEFCVPQHLGFQPFVATHFDACRYLTGMRSFDWHFIFPYCPAIVQIPISSVKLRHEMRLIAFVLYQLRLFFDHLMCVMLPSLHFIKN
jgi:hypothetical protein